MFGQILVKIIFLCFFQGNIMSQGKLLLFGPLSCREGDSGSAFRGKDLIVFLFDQSIIFSECMGKKSQFSNQEYVYKSHLQVIVEFFN